MADKTFHGNISIRGGATTAGGKITLKGGLNGAGADFSDWTAEGISANLKFSYGGTQKALLESGGNLTIAGAGFFSDSTVGYVSAVNEQSGNPFANGIALNGNTGWAFNHAASGWRMGFRGDAGNTVRYLWCADFVLFGVQPDDAKSTHNLRVEGTAYISSTLQVVGTLTTNAINGSTITGSTVNSTGNMGCLSILPTRAGDNDWFNNAIIINPGATQACLSFHPGTVAPQIRVGQGDNTNYFRNSNNSAFVTVAAVIADQSSGTTKQDIEDWPPRPLQARGLMAASITPDTPALDKVAGLRPKFFRRRHDDWLHDIRSNDGSKDGPHICGQDCEYTVDDPCPRVRDWQKGNVGLIAEEVYEVFPEAVHLDGAGNPMGISATALAAAAIAAVQELRAKIEVLEKKK